MSFKLAAAPVAGERRRLLGEEHPLDVARNLQVALEAHAIGQLEPCAEAGCGSPNRPEVSNRCRMFL